jgi:ethanolamine utilization microcompartment shell protein EutL
MVDGGAGAAQGAQQAIGQHLVILGNQNSHDVSLAVLA